MRAIRGLYVIRSGGACPQLSALRAEPAEDDDGEDPAEEGNQA